jgi:hypothetical protein
MFEIYTENGQNVPEWAPFHRKPAKNPRKPEKTDVYALTTGARKSIVICGTVVEPA